MLRPTATNLYHLFRCVKATKPGDAAVLATTDFPIHGLKLADDEALVRMSFAGINFIDTYYRSGLYKKAPTRHRQRSAEDPKVAAYPYIVGEEGSGAVVQCGNASMKSKWLNKRVAFFANEMGSYSSFTVVKEKDLFEIPNGVDDKTAAAALLQGCTAHYLTHDCFKATAGNTVLVHAAAGGTGLLVGQMAKAQGATVIGICGGAEKAALAKTVGKCDHVIDYKATPEWEKEVLKVAGGSKCHVVYDGVGKSTFAGSLSCLRPRGMMVSFGNASGAVEPIAPLVLSTHGSLFLTRPKLGDYMLTPAEQQQRVADVFALVASKAVTLIIGQVLPLAEASAAQTLLEGQKTTGKLLLEIPQ